MLVCEQPFYSKAKIFPPVPEKNRTTHIKKIFRSDENFKSEKSPLNNIKKEEHHM